MPVKIFFCYAHEDELLLKQLKRHLIPLQRQGLIDMWYDRDISAGTEWEQEISQRLKEAQIILLLISPDFMYSEYCYGIEMKRALERHAQKEVTVIPIILRPIYWEGILGNIQALPTDALPVTDPLWHNMDRAFFNVAEGIRKVVMQQVPTSFVLGVNPALYVPYTIIAQILESEDAHFSIEGHEIFLPSFMKQIILKFTELAQRSNEISEDLGGRIHNSTVNTAKVLSNAIRRAQQNKERQSSPRISDLPAINTSDLGIAGTESTNNVIQKLINMAVLYAFSEYFELDEFQQLLAAFDRGLKVQVGDDLPSMEYINQLAKVGGLSKAVDKLNGRGNPASIASSVEFIFEGLHLNHRLNKDEINDKTYYRH